MNFNLDITTGASQSSVATPLEGNMIHEVTFDGCEARDFQSKTGDQTFHVLEIKFHNADGVFTHTVWEPTEADNQDRQGAFGAQPSNVKVMMFLFRHLIDAVNPELAARIDAKEVSLAAPTWDALRTLMVKATEPGKGKTTKIKLIKNNKGEAMFPYFLNYNREGKLYMSTNFIGDKIFFTTKEADRIKKANTATPTPVTSSADSFELPTMKEEKKDDDFDLNF